MIGIKHRQQRKFDYYEVVMIGPDDAAPEVAGREGLVLGYTRDAGEVIYAVYVEASGRCWRIPQAKLETTGRKVGPADSFGQERVSLILERFVAWTRGI